MSARGARRGWGLGLTIACALVTLVGGASAGAVGQIVCHQEQESPRISPDVCNSAGTSVGWALITLLPPVLIFGLEGMRVSRRAIVAATLALLVGELALGILFGTLS